MSLAFGLHRHGWPQAFTQRLFLSTAASSKPSVPLDLIKSLRSQTGAPISAVRKALLEHENDAERAIDALRRRGAAVSAKRAARAVNEGLVGVRVSACGTRGALVELRCETDFVARNERFTVLLDELCAAALRMEPGEAEADPAERLQNDPATGAAVADAAGALGEGIRVGRVGIVAADGAHVAAYAHGGASAGRIAALVALSGAPAEAAPGVGLRLAMHVAAGVPRVVRREMLNEEDIERERSALREAAIEEGKQGHVVEKIVEGRMQKWFSQVCLMEQEMLVEAPGYDGKGRSVAKSTRADAGADADIAMFERFAIDG